MAKNIRNCFASRHRFIVSPNTILRLKKLRELLYNKERLCDLHAEAQFLDPEADYDIGLLYRPLHAEAQFLVPEVVYDIGLMYRPTSLAGRYDNPTP
jgi:hypothetical protein